MFPSLLEATLNSTRRCSDEKTTSPVGAVSKTGERDPKQGPTASKAARNYLKTQREEELRQKKYAVCRPDDRYFSVHCEILRLLLVHRKRKRW